MRAALLTLGMLAGLAGMARAGSCPNFNNTACAEGRTCCACSYSNSDGGCAMEPSAVCCGGNTPPAVLAPLPSWGVGWYCSAGSTCVNTTGGGIACKGADGSVDPAKPVCKPGASQPPSSTLPNVLVIGDSVSIGYEPPTAEALSSVAFVQHSPWDTRGGGAGATSYGRACLDNLLLTSMGQPVKWDVIAFNFGLHNLDNSSAAEEQYREDLTNITARLKATGSKLLYALTTPYMPDKTAGNSVVQQLNAIAGTIMSEHSIPTVDLYSRVTDKCGKVYKTCPICRKTPCSYHFTPEGYQWISVPLAAAIRGLL